MVFLVRRWLPALLVFATLGSQTLALLHRAAHQPAPQAQAQHEHHAGDEDHEGRHGAFDQLFALDTEGLACHLLDELAHGAGPAASVLPTAIAAAAYLLPALQTIAPGAAPAPFQARAPPR